MIFNKKISSSLIIAAGLSLSLLIFVVDILSPIGIADGICYTGVMLLSMWTKDKKFTIMAASTGIAFIIAGYFLSPPAPSIAEAHIAITNRMLSIAVVLICALMIIKYKKVVQTALEQRAELHELTENLTMANSQLEERVMERSAVIENALSKLKKSEAELQKLLEHEKELNELKTRFVSTASHEFRTPLATILTSLSLISKYGEQNEKEKQNKHIVRIKSAVMHLTDILNDILSLSKLEEGATLVSNETFSAPELVTEVVGELKLIAKLNQKIIYNHAGEDEITLDKKNLRHVLVNLISNAIKFSNEDGSVYITSDVKNSVFTIKVEDYGIGISAEDQKHLFERFFRGTNAEAIPGTGLGLNIVAKYVEIMNGKIDFKSELTKGTAFSVEFNLRNTES